MKVLAAFLLLVAGVASAADYDHLRAGESINGFPSWAERVIHEWINRARVDPQLEMARCGAACAEAACYKPSAPLGWTEALNRAARFHADEMAQQRYFAHDSACRLVTNIDKLYPVACDGAALCACVGGASGCTNGGCTSWNGRVGLFGAGAAGEIIASTPEPNDAFYLWLFERATTLQCGFTAQNGHRWLIFQSGGSVGIGVSDSAVGDFSGGAAPYRIPSGSHYPRQAAAVEAWANWYDARAPRSASVVVDGQCLPMRLSRGTPVNGAWSATVSGVGTECHRYYFSFTDAAGIEVTYPVTGSLGIGNSSCADWNTSRQLARCASAVPTSHRRAVKR